MLKSLFDLLYRGLEGFAHLLMRLMGLNISAPDHSHLSLTPSSTVTSEDSASRTARTDSFSGRQLQQVARYLPTQGCLGLFFNHLASVGWEALNIRQIPLMLRLSKYAVNICSFSSSLCLAFGLTTPLRPQLLQIYGCFPLLEWPFFISSMLSQDQHR